MMQEVMTDTIPTLVEKEGKREVREVPAVHIRLEKRLGF